MRKVIATLIELMNVHTQLLNCMLLTIRGKFYLHYLTFCFMKLK